MTQMRESHGVLRPSWTGTTLKHIAVITMLLDHIGAGLIEVGILNSSDGTLPAQMADTLYGQWWAADWALRCAGRLAFPLFAFLLVEGFLHTRNVRRYAGTMILFAVLSEIPFDLAFFNRWPDWHGQNIFFTLSIGLLTLMALRRAGTNKILKGIGILTGCAAAALLRTDYGMTGILLILTFYLLRDDRKGMYLVSGALLVLESLVVCGTAVLALLPIACYNGQREKSRHKYAFYWFYPVHLLLIFLFRFLVMGIGLLHS